MAETPQDRQFNGLAEKRNKEGLQELKKVKSVYATPIPKLFRYRI
jgi:hypothetical protein